MNVKVLNNYIYWVLRPKRMTGSISYISYLTIIVIYVATFLVFNNILLNCVNISYLNAAMETSICICRSVTRVYYIKACTCLGYFDSQLVSLQTSVRIIMCNTSHNRGRTDTISDSSRMNTYGGTYVCQLTQTPTWVGRGQ